MGLGDINQTIEGWFQQTKLLQPGEIIYVQGLTKGISNKSQYFPFDGSILYNNSYHSYYLSADISINYYKNFRYYENSLHVTADETNGIDIANAFNIAFGSLGVNITVSYDPSGLTFIGSQSGYSFDVTAMDVSSFQPDSSIWGESLVEDVSTTSVLPLLSTITLQSITGPPVASTPP
jgi:hypothetical protein